MRTSYFSFGQCHKHEAGNLTFDKDIVVEITAEDPRAIMFAAFSDKWGMEYDEPPEARFCPRGVTKLLTKKNKVNGKVSIFAENGAFVGSLAP